MSDENNTFENNGTSETNYSNQAQPTGNDYSSGKGQGTGLGIASMVCGILSIVTICCLPYAPIVLGIVAIVLGIVQIVKNEKKGMAIAGIVCGAVGLIGYILILAIGAYALSSGLYDEIMSQYSQYY